MQYQGGKKSMKFLNEMKEIIPFEHLVAILVEEGICKPEVGKKGGRPQTPVKILYQMKLPSVSLEMYVSKRNCSHVFLKK